MLGLMVFAIYGSIDMKSRDRDQTSTELFSLFRMCMKIAWLLVFFQFFLYLRRTASRGSMV